MSRASVITDSTGRAVLVSPTLRRNQGTFTFTLTGVTRVGATYSAAQNVVSSRTIIT